jgi:hypothetical protein
LVRSSGSTLTTSHLLGAVPVSDPTNAARQRRYRERQVGRLPPAERPICPACSITHMGARGVFCSRCWERLTEEGRQFKRDRVAKARAGKRDRL